MDGREKRQNPRVSATFKVEYESLDKFLLEYAQDISRGGIFLATECALPLGSVIRLILHLPGSDEKVHVIGQVVHRRGGNTAEGAARPPGMGVEFLDIDDRAVLRVRQFVDALSRQTDAQPVHLGARSVAVREIDVLVAAAAPSIAAGLAGVLGADFRVRTVPTALRCVAECAQQPPRILFVAQDLPGMSDAELCRAVRQRPGLADLPIVVLATGKAPTGGADAAGGAGVRPPGARDGDAAGSADASAVLAWPASAAGLRPRIERLLLHAVTPSVAGDRRALRGSIADIGLASLLGLLELERKTGYLLLVRDGETGMLGFREGRVVRADVRPARLAGRAKVFYLLDWTEGRFEFVSQEVGPCDEITGSIGNMLMEHAQITDEARDRDRLRGQGPRGQG